MSKPTKNVQDKLRLILEAHRLAGNVPHMDEGALEQINSLVRECIGEMDDLPEVTDHEREGVVVLALELTMERNSLRADILNSWFGGSDE